jgi:hypothetical protein
MTPLPSGATTGPGSSMDYERGVESDTAMIPISNIHLMLNRLASCGRPEFHYRKIARMLLDSAAIGRQGFRIASDYVSANL